jgi:hypothetical protein
MGAVIKKEFWTVEQIFRFVDERLDKNAFYTLRTEEGASKGAVIDDITTLAQSLEEFPNDVLNCVFNNYPLPNIVLCRARLFPDERFREGIGEDVWALCSGELILGTLYAYREGLANWRAVEEDAEIDYDDADDANFDWWNGESYQTLVQKASMGDREAKERLEAFNNCEIPFIRIMEIDDKEYIWEIDEVLEYCSDY